MGIFFFGVNVQQPFHPEIFIFFLPFCVCPVLEPSSTNHSLVVNFSVLILLYSHMGSLGHSQTFSKGLAWKPTENVHISWIWHLRYNIQPLVIISGDYLEFGTCLKAACVTRWNGNLETLKELILANILYIWGHDIVGWSQLLYISSVCICWLICNRVNSA